MKINLLSPSVYNKISAGEVVEKPASIVKELVENSIDAGAKNIRIEIEEGGIKNITISDDGCGIEKEDLTVAFMPHATSKIKSDKDLENIASLGFRGEALASISAVCQVKLSSKTKENPLGYSIKVDGGVFGNVVEVARSNGTTISVSNLFFNTPVRAKFLRKAKTEESDITHLVERFMLSNSDICFQYYIDGKQVYNTTSCEMADIIYTIYGNEVYDNLVPVDHEEDGYKVSGYVTKPKISKSNRTYQTLFVNGRCVENFLISSCITNVYASFLMKGRFPVYVLSLQAPTDCVDVNIHPSKREVKFENPNKIYGIIRRAVEKALYSVDQIQNFIVPSFTSEEKEENVEERKVEERPIIDCYPQIEDKPLMAGKSFESISDKNDENQELITLKSVDIEISLPQEEKSNDEMFKDLSNMSIKDTFGPRGNGEGGLFFFDQRGNNFYPETKEESFLHASVKDQMKILGTLFKTYIVVELDDSVYFIDQHAGHERILYDNLVKSVDNKSNLSQPLLAPYSFTVGAKESQAIDAILNDLKAIGFEIEKKEYQYTIISVPYVLSNIDLVKFADEIVEESFSFDKKASDYIHSKLCQTACKHAIKAGDSITKDECAYLIEEVRKGVMLCPHGRPITLIITKHEFEKMFKRIV